MSIGSSSVNEFLKKYGSDLNYIPLNHILEAFYWYICYKTNASNINDMDFLEVCDDIINDKKNDNLNILDILE